LYGFSSFNTGWRRADHFQFGWGIYPKHAHRLWHKWQKSKASSSPAKPPGRVGGVGRVGRVSGDNGANSASQLGPASTRFVGRLKSAGSFTQSVDGPFPFVYGFCMAISIGLARHVSHSTPVAQFLSGIDHRGA
jgi:hypothetical protein